jgi:hypothetical protein
MQIVHSILQRARAEIGWFFDERMVREWVHGVIRSEIKKGAPLVLLRNAPLSSVHSLSECSSLSKDRPILRFLRGQASVVQSLGLFELPLFQDVS